MKTMCSPIYHHSGFVAIDALGHMLPKCMSFHRTTVVITRHALCFRQARTLGMNPPSLKKNHPLFFAKPPLKSENCPYLFRQSPHVYCFL